MSELSSLYQALSKNYKLMLDLEYVFTSFDDHELIGRIGTKDFYRPVCSLSIG